MNPAVATPALERLRRAHPGWLIDRRKFLDGVRYDARPLDERGHRLVTETAGGLDEAIAEAEAGMWHP